MKIFKRTLYWSQDVKIVSRASEIVISLNKFKPTGSDTEYELFEFPNILKLEIMVGKENFRFTWERHIHVINTFQTALSWFYDKSKKDLFYKSSEDGCLYFNNDYNSLKVTAYSGKKTHQFLEIVPVLIERENQRLEGVLLSVNDKSAFATLTVSELTEMISVLTNFNFSSELVLYFEMAKALDGIKLVDNSILGGK